jgi:RimJ/RimL family protein N-acetyltransferase
MNESLFEGELVNLAAHDPERDPSVEARWTEDPCYWRRKDELPGQPLSAERIKKRHEKQKGDEEANRLYTFAVRSRNDDRLIGLAEIRWISWPNRTATLQIVIGDPADQGKDYGRAALRLLLRFTFAELNLHRLTARVPEYDEAALSLYREAGFTVEVRQREARRLGDRYYDLIWLGLLRPEWLSTRPSSG